MNEKNKNSKCGPGEQILSYYVDNRIKLMQEVLSLIKPKKMLSMAPEFIKAMQMSVVKSILLEELLGISNKRLRSILAGENTDSSSSESEIDEIKCDTISLQEISDNSDSCIDIQLSEHERIELEIDNAKLEKIKSESKRGEKRKIYDKRKKRKLSMKKVPKTEDEPVVSVLNLLELQARARAIRSQLANEILVDKEETNSDIKKTNNNNSANEDSSNSVICISPDNLSVVSVNSNSDFENVEENTNDQKKEDIYDDNQSSKNELENTNNDKTNDEEKQDELVTDPWKIRWLKSKKVQDVMRASNHYNNLRQIGKRKMYHKK